MNTIINYISEEAARKKKTSEEWLMATVQNADKCTTSSHIGRFTHPSADVKIRDIEKSYVPSGYISTATVSCTKDITVSSAAFLGTSKFLTLKLEDGKTVLSHFQENTEKIRQDLSSLTINYDSIREKILQIKENHIPSATDERIRQIFFPTGENQYHLLSVLPASSLLFEVKKRIRSMESQARAAHDKKSEQYGKNYKQVPNLTENAFGGTKPQNISTQNNLNGGRAYLLPAFPPKLRQNNIFVPKRDFFQSLQAKKYQPLFCSLHHCYELKHKNLDTRHAARSAEYNIMEQVLSIVFQLRNMAAGWSHQENCHLPTDQKIWLDDFHKKDRQADDTWAEEVATGFAQWMFHAYKKLLKNNAAEMGDGEYNALRHRIYDVLLDTRGV